MTSSLATRQGLLTRAHKRLSAILDEHTQLFATRLDLSEPRDAKELHRRIRATKATLSMEVGKVEDALIKYSSTVDELPVSTPSKEEFLKRAEANINTVEEVLDRAHTALTKLLQLQEELECQIQAQTTPSEEKYGNAQALVDQLVSRLQASQARSDSLADQIALCDQLSSITSQLELKGEHISKAFLQKQSLSKFSTEVQRHVLRQKCRKEAEGSWSTKVLLADAKEYVESELKINAQLEQRKPNHTDRQERSSTKFRMETRQTTRAPAPTCFYCNKPGHPAKSCPEVTTLSQRLQIIRTRKLCKNCGGENHLAMRCPRGACRACGVTGHHTSICTKLFSTETPRTPQQDKATKKIPARSPSQPTAAKMNTVTSDQGLLEAEEMDTVLHVSNRADVLILAGQAQRSSLSLEDKRFLCDKDLELSISATSTSINPQILLGCADMFTLLSNGLAPLYVLPSGLQLIPSRLGYLVAGRNHSFTETNKERATVNSATVTDKDDSQSWEDFCTFESTGVDEFVGPKAEERQRTDEAVWKTATSTSINPQILLGCADMFTLLSNGLAPLYVLPSGLQLIPSRLGYLVAGRNHSFTETNKERATIVPIADGLPGRSSLHATRSNMRYHCELLDWKRHSNLPRCQRVVAYVLRFIKQLLNRVNVSLRRKVEKSVPELHSVTMFPYITTTEREMALRLLVRNHQRVHLPPDRRVALKQLKLKEDDQGILRCHGRLGNSRLSFDAKYPCIIASKTDLARLIVQHAHLPLHCGTAHTMANVREKILDYETQTACPISHYQINGRERNPEFKQLREQVSAINLKQLSDDIKGLCERFDELNLRLPSVDTSRTIAPAEPSSELDRILRQMDETEKELHSVRKETFEINLLIEKTWQKDRSTDAIDHLKVKRRRLQSKESRLEEEMRDLEMRLEREKNGKHRNSEESRSRGHDRTKEERTERNASRERRHDRRREGKRESRQRRNSSTSCDHDKERDNSPA
ncbi:zinc knuckle [Ostertagia ostertagi]